MVILGRIAFGNFAFLNLLYSSHVQRSFFILLLIFKNKNGLTAIHLAIPCYESSKLPNISEEIVFEFVSSQPKQSRVNLWVDESNRISDSKHRH